MKQILKKIKLFGVKNRKQLSDKALKTEADIFVERYGKLIKKLSNE